MAKERQLRATAIVEWSEGGSSGVLVRADRHRSLGLPGVGLGSSLSGYQREALARLIRDLHKNVGLYAYGALLLFRHAGARNDHQVYLVRTRGEARLVNQAEVPALGICDSGLRVAWNTVALGFAVDGLRLGDSSRAIIERFYQLRTQHPDLWAALAALEAGWDSDAAAPPDPAESTGTGRGEPPHVVGDGSGGGATRIQIVQSMLELTSDDIVTQDVDAVVNAANSHLANGGGVCGAIHRAAGVRELEAACRRLGGCPTGEARITPGFKLRARHIIHAVGPIYASHTPEEARRLLADAYTASLELASAHGLRSIAFPSLSTGIYGYPAERAAPVALEAIIEYLRYHPEIELVRFVLRDDTRDIYEEALRKLLASYF